MAKDVNLVTLEGTVGRDSETKYTASGKAVTNFSLATSRNRKKEDGTWERVDTQWHRVVYWGDFSAFKGDRVACEGRIQYREYEAGGVKKQGTDIVCWDAPKVVQSRGGGKYAESHAPKPQAVRNDEITDDDVPF